MPNEDLKRVYDALASAEGGMSAGLDPALIRANQLAFAGNISIRGAFPKTRPTFKSRRLTFDSQTTQGHFTGIFQGAAFYVASDPNGNSIILSVGGRLFRISVVNQTLVSEISASTLHPADFDFVHLFQAENYMLAMCKQNKTLAFDGSSTRALGTGELPGGTLGVYSWGRVWMALDDQRSFIAGDLVGGSSGTASLGYVDAILKTTENTFLTGGGSFKVPSAGGPITAMMPLASQDSSLGIGPLLVGTTDAVFSCQAPVDRTTWQNLSYPIQSLALLGVGPLGPRSSIPVNGDMWFRAFDGARSFLAARRDFDYNRSSTPMSFEMQPVFGVDQRNLLFYGSSAYFDNRMLMTVSPYRSTTGVLHNGIAAMNFDAISTLGEKSPPVWEGLYTGLPIYQIVSAIVDRQDRCFIIADNAGTIELWELLKEDEDSYDVYDAGTAIQPTRTRTPIQSWAETRSMPCGNPFQLKHLVTAEVYLDELVDNVSITIKYRPDQYPDWITWTTIALCSPVSNCAPPAGCAVAQTGKRQYAARILLTDPDETCNTIAKNIVNRGYEFQFRIEVTGHFRLRKFRPHTVVERDDMAGSCPTTPECVKFEACDIEWFTYDAHGA